MKFPIELSACRRAYEYRRDVYVYKIDYSVDFDAGAVL
jgi:hypothetical protein